MAELAFDPESTLYYPPLPHGGWSKLPWGGAEPGPELNASGLGKPGELTAWGG